MPRLLPGLLLATLLLFAGSALASNPRIVGNYASRDGLRAHWPLDDVHLRDASGNGLQARRVSLSSAQTGTGLDVPAGPTFYVEAPSVVPKGPMTVTARIKPRNKQDFGGTWQIISNNPSWILGTWNKRTICFTVKTKHGWQYDSCVEIPVEDWSGEWALVIGSYDPRSGVKEVHVLFEGSSEGVPNVGKRLSAVSVVPGALEDRLVVPKDDGTLTIGRSESNVEHFEGAVRDVRIYERLLAPFEREALFHGREELPWGELVAEHRASDKVAGWVFRAQGYDYWLRRDPICGEAYDAMLSHALQKARPVRPYVNYRLGKDGACVTALSLGPGDDMPAPVEAVEKVGAARSE